MTNPRIPLLPTLLALAVIALIPAIATAQNPVLKSAVAIYDGIVTETLPNGLRVYLKPLPGTGIVTTMVPYRVGSCDEDLTNTGLAHYLEHLLFKGTDKLVPGDIDRLTLRNGGANNAYTSEDMTNYHFDFAADRWIGALKIEADRMRNTRIDDKHEFQGEKQVVVEELKRNEDGPWDLEYKAILPRLFGKTAPYGHPVIGEREHVFGATAEVITGFYDRWYHPNNAAIVIVGDFNPDEAMKEIKKLFTGIPAGKLPERKKAEPMVRTGPVRHEMPSKFEVARMIVAYNTVDATHADAPALDVLAQLIGGGRTSRLYKSLVEGAELAGDVNAGNTSGRYPGYFEVLVEMLKDRDRKQAEKIAMEQLAVLREKPPTEVEMKRVRQMILASTIFQRESVHSLADSIARAVTIADLDWLKGYLPKVLAVTPEDVQRVAKKYLDPNASVTVWSVPRGGKPEGGKEEGKSPRRKELQRADAQPAGGLSLKNAKRVELPNGLVLLLLENKRVPIVVAQAMLRDANAFQADEKLGLALLTGGLLDEGSTKRTGTEIAEAIEDIGGKMGFSGGGGTMSVLAGDRKLGLELLLECLTKPAFPEDAFKRIQTSLLSDLEEQQSQPMVRAREGFREAVYGPKHPLGRPAAKVETLAKLTRKDCIDFHKMVYVPGNTILAIVGDFDTATVIDEVTKLTAGWKGDAPAKPVPVAVTKPEKFTQKIVTMPESAQLYFFLGHGGITRKDPDYFKLLVMDYILGTGPGFTDRLSARLRDREGLAYTVNANITQTATNEPGLMTCFIGTDAKNFDRVKKEFLEELNRIRDEPATKDEVEDAKQYLLGNLPFKFTTNAALVGQLMAAERFGLGFDYLEEFRKAVAAVTAEDVQAAAKKHIDPERMFLIAAGAIDASGKVLAKPKP